MDRDVHHVLHGVTFEWNRAKATEPDEARDAVIGHTQSQALLFVVHVIRDEEEIIRIISARHATSQERGTYEQFSANPETTSPGPPDGLGDAAHANRRRG